MTACSICGDTIDRGTGKRPRKYCELHRRETKRKTNAEYNRIRKDYRREKYLIVYGRTSMPCNQAYLDYMLKNGLIIKGVQIINKRDVYRKNKQLQLSADGV
jgi:hypothetical protein